MATLEYLHTWIPAAESSDAPYPDESIQEELDRLGQEGWELVDMTPHWEWTYDTIDVTHEYQGATEWGPMPRPSKYEVEAPYSVPDYISGWYCTFKRFSG